MALLSETVLPMPTCLSAKLPLLITVTSSPTISPDKVSPAVLTLAVVLPS